MENTYCDNEAGAAIATGIGEEVIRISGCFLIVELMRNEIYPPKAGEEALKRIVKANRGKTTNFQDAFLAVRKDGEDWSSLIAKGILPLLMER